MEGQNLILETRYAEGTEERLPELAADLVSRKVEVIVVVGGARVVRAANHATDTIPIVGVGMGDPVALQCFILKEFGFGYSLGSIFQVLGLIENVLQEPQYRT
jgi:predicted polyphosphate/ATP-dependent NAD kinase